jgi:hypothetical protein
MSNGNMSSTILRIYQTLAVEFETARTEKIYFTLFDAGDLVVSPVAIKT